MKHLKRVALLGAGATVLASAPRAVHAAPRAEPTDALGQIAAINAAVNAMREKHEAAMAGRITQEEANALVEPINAEIDRLSAALTAAQLGGGAGDSLNAAERQHSTAFATWFRQGEVDADLTALAVQAALTTQSDPDGGYLVPVDWEQGIDRVLGTITVMRSLARVIQVGGGGYRKLVNVGGATSGWTGEEEERDETKTPSLRELSLPFGELYAEPAVTQTMLDDARFDVEGWLAGEIAIEFSEEEGAAFIKGNGKKKPRGIRSYDMVANTDYSWGKVGFVPTGAAAGFSAEKPADALIKLLYALKQGYRNGAAFLTSDTVMAEIRTWKDGNGNYLWSPPSASEHVGTILGKPVHTDDYMDTLGANKFPIAVADWKKAYTIADRFGTRVLRDPFTKKPFVKFYTTKRVGGGITNFEAIKFLKCANG